MGKYIRRKSCRSGGGTGPPPAAVVVASGIRTRSRCAAVPASAPAPKRSRKAGGVETAVEGREDGASAAEEGRCCYLQLRSRKLYVTVPAAASSTPVGEDEDEEDLPAVVPLAVADSAASKMEEAAVDVDSRCSSTASSAHVVALGKRIDYSTAEARDDCCEEISSLSDDDGREATPSSRAPGDLSDQEYSSKAADVDDPKRRRSSATAAWRALMPPVQEIEEFFAAAEKAEAKRFATKYNFDVVCGMPLEGGRFQWALVG